MKIADWRDVPFYTALSVGAVSTESDVWLYNDTLFVGHEQGALTTARTFESLYINPILDVLKRQNPTVCNHSEHSVSLLDTITSFNIRFQLSHEPSDSKTKSCMKHC